MTGVTGGGTDEMQDSVHSLAPNKGYFEWKRENSASLRASIDAQQKLRLTDESVNQSMDSTVSDHKSVR